MKQTKRTQVLIAALGAATVAHGGYTGNTVAVDPALGFAGVVLTNRTGDRLKAYAGHGRLLALMVANSTLHLHLGSPPSFPTST